MGNCGVVARNDSTICKTIEHPLNNHKHRNAEGLERCTSAVLASTIACFDSAQHIAVHRSTCSPQRS